MKEAFRVYVYRGECFSDNGPATGNMGSSCIFARLAKQETRSLNRYTTSDESLLWGTAMSKSTRSVYGKEKRLEVGVSGIRAPP